MAGSFVATSLQQSHQEVRPVPNNATTLVAISKAGANRQPDPPKSGRGGVFFAFIIGAALAAPSAQSSRDVAVVSTTSGQVSGIATRDGVVAYLGIPYAAPPVGALRWR